jgi:hypothetical protein
MRILTEGRIGHLKTFKVTVLLIRRSHFVGLFVHSVPNKSDEEATQDLCMNNKMRDVGEHGIK